MKYKFNINGKWVEYDVWQDREKYWFIFDKKYKIRKIIAKDELEHIVKKEFELCYEKLPNEYFVCSNKNIDEFNCYCFVVKKGTEK